MNPLLQNFSTAITGLAALGLFFFYFLITKRNEALIKKVKTAPTAEGGWPLLGHIPLFSGTLLPHIRLGEMADKWGPVFNIQLGTQRALVVSSPEAAEECFTTNDAVVSSRPKSTSAKYLTYDYAMLFSGPNDTYWREMRKIITTELLSSSRLELFHKARYAELETSLKELRKIWSEKKDASGYIKVDMKEWFWTLSFNVMLRMVVGQRYSEAKHEGIEAQKWRKAISEFFRLLGMTVVSDAFPILEWLDIGGHVKAMKRAAKEFDDVISQWLEEHQRRKANGDQEDFMDAMLAILDGKDKIGKFDVDTVHKATCLNVVSGGTDTSSDVLTWALSLLLNNRQALEKVKEEISMHTSGEELVKESDISKMSYLRAIIKETLRLYPPSTLLPRETTEDCIIGGYHVPRGTRLIINFWKIQHDPRVWSDPFEFKPERFLTTHKNVDVRGKNFELLPFGSGRRRCPGIVLGLQMLHITIASFLHEFEISTPLNAPIDMTAKFGMSNVKADPLEVLVKPRLS